MAEKRNERIRELIRQNAAQFIRREADSSSLITVTNVDLSHNFGHAMIQITVFPTDRERPALEFLSRHRAPLRQELKKNVRSLPRIPQLDFAIDQGEKNRQRIDELSEQSDTTEE